MKAAHESQGPRSTAHAEMERLVKVAEWPAA